MNMDYVDDIYLKPSLKWDSSHGRLWQCLSKCPASLYMLEHILA
jgi:hypothetical protein